METDFRALAHRFEPAELFYKELAEKQAAGGEEYKLYLESLSKDDLIRQGLVVPDLFPPYRRYPEYRSIFPENGDIAVWKHSRYTPVYMHTHEYFEIICVMEGTAVNRFEDGEPMEMVPGDILILPDGTVHELSVMSDDGIVINIMLAFLEYYNHRKYYEKVTKSQVNCLFAYLLRGREHYMIAGGEQKKLELYEYIRKHFIDVTLESAAADFGYSSAYFSRYCRKITGRTFSDIVIELRLEAAMRLLRTTALPVSQISEITGYGSEEHFIRQFRKYKGMTPSGYRKNNTGN